MIAPAKENNTKKHKLHREGNATGERTFGKERRMYDILLHRVRNKVGTNRVKAHQTFQVLAILPAETPICPPYPVPAGSMSTSSSEEYYGIIGLHCRR